MIRTFMKTLALLLCVSLLCAVPGLCLAEEEIPAAAVTEAESAASDTESTSETEDGTAAEIREFTEENADEADAGEYIPDETADTAAGEIPEEDAGAENAADAGAELADADTDETCVPGETGGAEECGEEASADEPEADDTEVTAGEEDEIPEEYINAVVLTDTVLWTPDSCEKAGAIAGGEGVIVLAEGDEFCTVLYKGERFLIFSDALALYCTDRSQVSGTVRSIVVTTNLGGEKKCRVGQLIILTAHLYGFENDKYTLQWQYSPDKGATAFDIPGADGPEYGYFLDEENYGWLFRVTVSYEPNEEAAD